MSTFDLIVLGFFVFAAIGGVIDLGRFLLKHGEIEAAPLARTGSRRKRPSPSVSAFGFDPSRKEAE